ncbi:MULTISPECIES: YkvA family protein [unclassified Caballeronia]|uniref:YkvA family protein n=1 Tax=unclassified Caballeronia TaxID=2646786 RepID=UPI00286408C4|nr:MULTISPECIES: YkvA family protein [unclassified Caballeronia]MDR5755101.1 YkvA family protein [Caballeronia sp. LZ024]MDR5841536.1 YkvA family protein [Caballeronia sp. LZ031]
MLQPLKAWATRLKRDVVTLMFAGRDPVTPLVAKFLAFATVAYALSPMDLISDFIPVLGYLDDLVVVPLGVWLCLRLIPKAVIEANRGRAEVWLASKPVKPRSMLGLAAILTIWAFCAWLLWRWLAR